VTQRGRPDKKVYPLTERGRAELARWIAEPLSATRPGRGSALSDNGTRDVTVKPRGAVYGSGSENENVAAVHGQIEAPRTERLDSRDTYRELEKRVFPDPSVLRGAAIHQYLVLRGGIRAEESALDWLDEVAAAPQETS